MADQTIVVTGVSRGLGAALARGFAEYGIRVVGCARSPEPLRQLTADLGTEHDFSPVDVADNSQVARWAERVIGRFGPPDLVINNAALINENAPLWEVPPAEFDRLIDVNIKGVYYVARAFLPAMIARGSGVLANLSSGWGRSTSAEVAPYCATKWAIEGLTQALAQELPPGMAAVPVNPGVINTAMLQSCFAEGAASYPDPAEWAQRAAPFFLRLGPADNGRPATVL